MKNYSSFLINEPPLQVLPTLAKAIGLNEAIVLQQLHYWIANPKNKGILDGGEKWIYNTYAEWAVNFPFWCKRTINSVFLGLEKNGYIITKLIRAKGGCEKYYRINYEMLESLSTCKPCTEIVQTLHGDRANLACAALPYNTETTTETTQRESGGATPLASVFSEEGFGLLPDNKLPVKNTIMFPPALLGVPGFKEAFTEWMAIRRDNKKAATVAAQNRALKTLAEHPTRALAYVKRASITPWMGVNWEWLKDEVPIRRSPSNHYSSSTAKPINWKVETSE